MLPKYFNKRLITLFFFIIIRALLYAQEKVQYSNKPFSKFSFTVGLTTSDLIKDSINYAPGILFNGGFIYSLTLSDKLNANIELLYSGKAIKIDEPIIKFRYYYVDIPLYAQIKLSENIKGNVGGQFSKFTNSTVTILDGTSTNGVNALKHKNIKDMDYVFLLGAEFDLNDNLTLEVRYSLSASTFFEKNKANFSVFQVSFNYTAIKTYRQFFHMKT